MCVYLICRCVFDVSVLMIALPTIKQSQLNLIVHRAENTAFLTKGVLSVRLLFFSCERVKKIKVQCYISVLLHSFKKLT